MSGPTIAHAEVKVDLDGKRIPSEARALGRESGEGMGEEFGDASNKEILGKLKEGANERDSELTKGAKKSGENYGIKFSDSMDKILKSRLSKTSDEIAKIFEDSNGIDKYVENYKGAGDATDDLRKKIADLGDRGVLTGDQFEDLSRRVDEYSEATARTAKRNEDYLRSLRANSEELERQDDAHRRFTASINRMADESTARLDRMVDDQAKAFEQRHGPAIDRAIKNQDRFTAAVTRGQRSLSTGREGLSSFLDRLDDFAPSFERNRKSIDGVGDSIEGIGRRAEGFGSKIDRVATSLFGLGKNGDSAGRGSQKASLGVGKLASAFSQFDPGDNFGQALLLIIALAPQIAVLAEAAGAGLLILAGGAAAFAAAGVGFGVAFSNILGDLKKLDPAIRPAAKAIQDFIGRLGDVRLELQKALFTPAILTQFQAFSTSLIGTLNSAFSQIAPALSRTLLGISKDLNSSGFKRDLTDLFKGFGPVIEDLGTIARNVFGIIGQVILDVIPYTKNFTSEVATATGKFLDFLKSPEGKNAVKKFFDDLTPVLKAAGDAIVVVGGALAKLVTPQNIENTTQILEDLANTGPKLASFANDLNRIVVAVAGVISVIGDVAKGIGQFFDDLFTAGDKAVIGIVQMFKGLDAAIRILVSNIAQQFAGIGKALSQVATGDFAGAAKTIKGVLDSTQSNAESFANNLGAAMGNAGAKFATLDSKAQSSLTALAERFNVPQDKVAEFGGKIAALADAAGVDISSIGNAKGWDDLQAKTDAAGGTIKALKDQFSGLPKNVSTTVEAKGAEQAKKQTVDFGAAVGALTGKTIGVKEEGAKESTARVAAMSAKIGAVVGKSVVVKEDGAQPSASRVAALSGKIGALIGKTVPVKETGADPSSSRVSNLRSKIGALAGKTVGVGESGANAASGRVEGLRGQIGRLAGKSVNVGANVSGAAAVGALAGAIAGLHDKTVTVRTIQSQRNANAIGGIIAGGQQIAGGRAFANGGILRSRTYLANGILAGEAGAEAIVPLTGTLARIDPSVRGLAAAARGLASATRSGSYIEKGAIQIVTPAANPRIVAEQVMDRLVPLGD